MVGVWREDPHWHPVLRRETYCCIMELHLCAASGYGRVGFSTQCVPVTGVSGFVPVRRYLWYICWCWVRCKDKLPYNGSLGLLWLTLAKSWHTCMHRQRGEPKPPSGGSAGAELPVCNKAKPRLKQNKNRFIWVVFRDLVSLLHEKKTLKKKLLSSLALHKWLSLIRLSSKRREEHLQSAWAGGQEFAELAFSDRGLSSHPSQRSKAEHEQLHSISSYKTKRAKSHWCFLIS